MGSRRTLWNIERLVRWVRGIHDNENNQHEITVIRNPLWMCAGVQLCISVNNWRKCHPIEVSAIAPYTLHQALIFGNITNNRNCERSAYVFLYVDVQPIVGFLRRFGLFFRLKSGIIRFAAISHSSHIVYLSSFLCTTDSQSTNTVYYICMRIILFIYDAILVVVVIVGIVVGGAHRYKYRQDSQKFGELASVCKSSSFIASNGEREKSRNQMTCCHGAVHNKSHTM